MVKRMPWLVPAVVVAAVATGVWWFVFRESSAERGHRLITAAREAMGRQDYVAAERDLREALEIAPQNGLLHHNLAILYLRQRRVAEARAAFQRAADAHGPQASQVRAEELFQLANIAYAEKNWSLTAAELERAIEADPQRAQFHTRLIDLQLGRIQNRGAADSATTRFLRLCGRNAANLENAAFVYFQGKVYPLAESLLREAVALDDSAFTAHASLARVFWRDGDLAGAIAYAEAIRARYPRAVPLLVVKGNLLVEARRPKEAEKLVDEALVLAPRDFEVHKLRCSVLANQGRLQEALDEVALTRELTNDPTEHEYLLTQERLLRSVLAATGGTGTLGGTAPGTKP